MGRESGPRLVLASASESRAALLAAAGLAAEVRPAAVDETAIKVAMRRDSASAEEAAVALAELKARQVSVGESGALVIGADQILECNGKWFDKAGSVEEAREQLLSLRGRRHDLVTAAVVVRDGERLWHHVERATLAMRPFSDTFLDRYVAEQGATLCRTVGAYRLEGPGVQLFQSVEGSYFTILGMPLLPLLEFLREQGVLER